ACPSTLHCAWMEPESYLGARPLSLLPGSAQRLLSSRENALVRATSGGGTVDAGRPRPVPPPRPERSTTPIPESLPPTNGQTPEARLLVVDDEPNIVELLSTSLRFAGFEVVTALTGSDAVKAVERSRPDLVLLDVMLPDIDGFVVLRRLRTAYRPIPVLFL